MRCVGGLGGPQNRKAIGKSRESLTKGMETKQSGGPFVNGPGNQQIHWGYTDFVIYTQGRMPAPRAMAFTDTKSKTVPLIKKLVFIYSLSVKRRRGGYLSN